MPTTVESDILNASEFADALRVSRIPLYEVAEGAGIARARLSAFKNGHGLLDDEDLQAIVDFFKKEGVTFDAEEDEEDEEEDDDDGDDDDDDEDDDDDDDDDEDEDEDDGN